MPKESSLHGGDLFKRLELSNVDPRTCSRPRILTLLSSLLETLVVRNERNVGQDALSNLTVFHGLRAPSISIDKYLERIFKYANCSPSCFLVAYVYMDRFMQCKPGFSVTSLNVHRLLVTSVLLAAKFLDDAYYNNAYYAKVGGVSTTEMNTLELEFLFHVNFKLQVTVSAFESYCRRVDREILQIERPQIGCALDGVVAKEQGNNRLRKQRVPTTTVVRCRIAGL